MLAIDVPGDRNAFTLWKEASARAYRKPGIETRLLTAPYPWPAPTDAEALDYLARNAEALELWRRGSERPEAMVVRPADMRVETDFGPVIQDHRNLARIALTTASGRIARGDMEGAWAWYRTALRASRLLAHNGPVILSLVGTAEYGMVAVRCHAWAEDARVDAAMLRRALADVLALNDLTVRPSDVLKLEYLSVRDALGDPSRLFREFVQERTSNPRDRGNWVNHLTPLHHLAWFAGNEPRRTQRLQQLAYANWLEDCDDLPADRPGILRSAADGIDFYDRPASRSAGGVSGAELVRRVADTRLASLYLSGVLGVQRGFDRDRGQRASLLISLATALYEREHERPPASLDALVGPYLERLPEGYIPPPPKTPEP